MIFSIDWSLIITPQLSVGQCDYFTVKLTKNLCQYCNPPILFSIHNVFSLSQFEKYIFPAVLSVAHNIQHSKKLSCFVRLCKLFSKQQNPYNLGVNQPLPTVSLSPLPSTVFRSEGGALAYVDSDWTVLLHHH